MSHPFASRSGIASQGLAMTRNLRAVLLAALLLFALYISAQQQIITTTTDYITRNEFTQADHYLDSILKLNPKTVDALMMKGNVLLNQAWNNSAKSHFNAEKAESIFDTSRIDGSYFIPIIPIDTSVKIDKLWNECLRLQPERTDIKKGLCSLYSLSLRTVELKRLLIQMQPIITQSEENAYQYAEYARNLKNRGRFEDAMEIYTLIAGMFPDLAGIRCDMANEYFYAGEHNKALAYLDSTLVKKEVDQTSYINAAALYSTLGYYDQALKTFQSYSEKDTLIEADFYKGLVMFAQMDTGFSAQMHRFLDHASEQSYYDEIQVTRKLLPFGRMPFTTEDFEALANDPKIARYYKVLILQRGVVQFKNECEPLLLLGTMHCAIKNYSAATQFLEEDPACKLNPLQEEQRLLTLGYALYKKGDKEKALADFEPLLEVSNNFTQQAAQYFTAKIYREKGETESAKKMFARISSGQKNPSKYVWLALGYLGR